MASHSWRFSILETLLGLAGMAWKLLEGYPIVHAPGFLWSLDAGGHAASRPHGPLWLEICTGTPGHSLASNFPWFILHLALYISQLAGFVLMVLHETLPHGGLLHGVGVVAAMGCMSSCFGFSTAMPMLSLWMLHQRRAGRFPAQSKRSKLLLRAVFWFTGITHVGAFLVACTATMLGPDQGPFHLMNSLLGVPDCSHLACAEAAQRQARLRQINEMTGTSSGFFMAMGLFCHALETARKHLSWRLLARLFLVSLVIGPAAGGADALLLRGPLIGLGDGTEDQKESKYK